MSSRHFVNPEDMSLIEMVLFGCESISCDFFSSRKNTCCILLKFKLWILVSSSRICCPNALTLFFCRIICSGSTVNGVTWSWIRRATFLLVTYSSIWVGFVMMSHWSSEL